MESTYKRAALALAVVVGASAAAYFYLRSEIYYPVVRLALPDGLSITAVLLETKERKACSTANERFVAPFKQCKDCRILATRCDHQIEGLELAMRQGVGVPHPMV